MRVVACVPLPHSHCKLAACTWSSWATRTHWGGATCGLVSTGNAIALHKWRWKKVFSQSQKNFPHSLACYVCATRATFHEDFSLFSVGPPSRPKFWAPYPKSWIRKSQAILVAVDGPVLAWNEPDVKTHFIPSGVQNKHVGLLHELVQFSIWVRTNN